MDTLTKISKVNVLFDKHPGREDFNVILRFPIRFMTQEEIDVLNELVLYGEFYIGFIDFNEKMPEWAKVDPRLKVVKDISTALRILLGDNIPYFDPYLN